MRRFSRSPLQLITAVQNSFFGDLSLASGGAGNALSTKFISASREHFHLIPLLSRANLWYSGSLCKWPSSYCYRGELAFFSFLGGCEGGHIISLWVYINAHCRCSSGVAAAAATWIMHEALSSAKSWNSRSAYFRYLPGKFHINMYTSSAIVTPSWMCAGYLHSSESKKKC